MFHDIIAVSLNPSLDISLWVDRLSEGETVAVSREAGYAGGKAVNVARTLAALSTPCRLFSLIGEENAGPFRSLLEGDGVSTAFCELEGHIRENLSLVLPDGKLYKLDRKGFAVSDGQMKRFGEMLFPALRSSDSPLAVFAGSLPEGVTKEQYVGLMKEAGQAGASLAVDTAFLGEKELRSLHPFLIKPNQEELFSLAGRRFSGLAEMALYAKSLSEDVEIVLASLGENGLIGAFGCCCYHAAVPNVLVKSTVSAGDATLAGFLAAWKRGQSFSECIRFAAACGTASVRLDGSAVVCPAGVAEVEKGIVLREI